MNQKEVFAIFFSCFIFKSIASTDTLPSDFTRYNFTEKDQCVLCAHCKTTPGNISKSSEKCNSTDVIQHFQMTYNTSNVNTIKSKIGKTCFDHGDYHEIFYGRSTISILPPSNETQFCYFNITYYNITLREFIFNDFIIIRHEDEIKRPSELKKWQIKWKRNKAKHIVDDIVVNKHYEEVYVMNKYYVYPFEGNVYKILIIIFVLY